MARKQTLENRLSRMNKGLCPIHGSFMVPDLGDSFYNEVELPAVVECCRKNCSVQVLAYSAEGPYEIMPEHSYIFDEEAIQIALSAPKNPTEKFGEHKSKSKFILAKTGGKCYYCGCELEPENNTVDHIIPRSNGGSDQSENLVPCCRFCNSLKGNRSIEELRFAQCMRVFKKKSGITFTLPQIEYLREQRIKLDIQDYIFWFEKDAEDSN